MKKLMLLAVLIILASFGSTAYAVDPKNEVWSQRNTLPVKNPGGEYLGTAKDVLLSPSGTVAFVIISVGDKGEKDVVVPLAAFSYDRENKVLILRMSKDRIDTAPEFSVKGLYKFFGLAPPWTDTARQGRKGK